MDDSLRNAVERDFSKSVYVSHGFSGSSELGSHLFCEVDASSSPEIGVTKVDLVMWIIQAENKSDVNDEPNPSNPTRSRTDILHRLYNQVTIVPASYDSLLGAIQSYINPRTNEDHIKNSHPNLVPLYGAFLGKENYVYLAFPTAAFTLQSVLHFSPEALKNDWQVRLMLYQVVAGIAYYHSNGVNHGNLTPSSVLLDGTLWCWLTGFRTKEPQVLHTLDWRAHFRRWWKGELSNYDYLLVLNRLAGRRWGDRRFHTVMPWVVDFSVKPDDGNDAGWRDLTKSKWRLAKGDEQLDFTYSSAEIPHHVSDDCLSELGVCIYKARKLPLSVLKRDVRSVYEPNEYPGNVQRIFQWTPDECIPEFYSDADVFRSVHPGMSDLAVPSWARDAEDFIFQHRSALESDHVSRSLHHWIDLTFGYKLSGEPAVSAKNVTLVTGGPTVPRACGRRQLFFRPHPIRRPSGNGTLEQLEEAGSFCESARHLSAWYGPNHGCEGYHGEQILPSAGGTTTDASADLSKQVLGSDNGLFERLSEIFHPEEDDVVSAQSWDTWQAEVGFSEGRDEADIFSVGCLTAEVYLHRPLFDTTSAAAWSETGVLPEVVQLLPPTVRPLVEATLARDAQRRPTAETLLRSPFFPAPIRSAFIFLSSLYILTSKAERLQYAAKMAQESAFVLMGGVAAELCAPACLAMLVPPYSDLDPKATIVLLKSLLQVLSTHKAKQLLVPVVQNIFLNHEPVHLKSGLLTSSFLRNMRRVIGASLYLQHIHTPIVLNLRSADSQQASPASVALLDTCLELGLPITLHQTVAPLLQLLGRDITTQGIQALVDIAQRFGRHVMIKHWLPPLKSTIISGAKTLPSEEKLGPACSWRLLAAADALTVLELLLPLLNPLDTELLKELSNIYIRVLQLKISVESLSQGAAKGIVAICNQAGADSTSAHVMPQIKLLFDQYAFGDSQPNVCDNGLPVVHIIYPALASLLGIEMLRQALPTWLLLEQALSKKFEWKWTDTKAVSRCSTENSRFTEDQTGNELSELSPASLLLHGVGWSIPQSKLCSRRRSYRGQVDETTDAEASSSPPTQSVEPWSWVPFNNEAWGGAQSFSKIGAIHTLTKDEQSWKLNAIVVHSWRAHNGSVRRSMLGEDETVLFTAGGLRGRSSVRKWDLSTSSCIMEYCGHEEAVIDVCFLHGFERVASCDGTIHIWSCETGDCLTTLDEVKDDRKVDIPASTDITLSNGIWTVANTFTCMHYLENESKLLAGTSSGWLRFIDPSVGRQLYSWRCDTTEASLSSIVSSVSSSSSMQMYDCKSRAGSSWIAVGFNSGHCTLLDHRSGSIIGQWKAHSAAITKLAPLVDDNFLVSSSMDRTISVWDLRRGWPLKPQVYQGHSDGIGSFALWGNNILSAAGNRIGVSSFLKQQDQVKQSLYPRKIYTADQMSRNLSKINTINVLPFSRHFVIGTEDGLVKACT